MADELLPRLRVALNDNTLHKIEVVQSLWSGYGEIARYHSPKNHNTIIVKQVSVPQKVQHPRGWNTQTSHQRKLRSYQVEQFFYTNHAYQCDEYCRVPQVIECASDGLLILEDLDASGFEVRRENGDARSVKLGIRWLANFHARFLNSSGHGLWAVGSYWHLQTRQDEWQAMPQGELKNLASVIDTKLNEAKFKTLIHGDAKLANFCFDLDGNDLAAVDFQYVGCGIGMKDLAYFLGCCYDSVGLMDNEYAMLDCYFEYLQRALKRYQLTVDWQALRTEWTELYAFAWADFYRFLVGWSPQHYKISPYMHRQFEKVQTVLG